jgi:hypothetical protein
LLNILGFGFTTQSVYGVTAADMTSALIVRKGVAYIFAIHHLNRLEASLLLKRQAPCS